MIAIKNEHKKVVQLLLQNEVDVNMNERSE